MPNTKGAEEVAKAFWDGRKLKRGNARTDGKFYYLFDNAIVSSGPPNEAEAVRGRLLGRLVGSEWYFTFAGWVTQSTLRHISVAVPFYRQLSISRGRAYFMLGEQRVELDSNRWYNVYDLSELFRRKQNEGLPN